MNLRVEMLKGYIAALVADGDLKISDGVAVLDRLVACVLRDAREALKDLAKLGAVQGVRFGTGRIAAKVADPVASAALHHYGGKLAEVIEREGFEGIWNRIKGAAPKRNPGKPRAGLDHLVRK